MDQTKGNSCNQQGAQEDSLRWKEENGGKEDGMKDKRETYRNKFPVPASGTLSETSDET